MAVVSALVTDPDGVQDLVGGTLADAAANSTYGAFTTPGGQGTFTYSLKWSAVDMAKAIGDLPSGGGTRDVVATFFDSHGHATSKTLTLTLGCPVVTDGVCDGACVDLEMDPKNCGACGVIVNTVGGLSCKNGAPACPKPTDVACNDMCVDAMSDLFNCGGCGNSCYTWAAKQGVSIGFNSEPLPLCVQGSCAIEDSATDPTQSCKDVCSKLSPSISCYPHLSCGELPGFFSGCATYIDGPFPDVCTPTGTQCDEVPPKTKPKGPECPANKGSWKELTCYCSN
jgi:hypothetical protein